MQREELHKLYNERSQLTQSVLMLRANAARNKAMMAELADALRAVLGVYGPRQSAMPRERALMRALNALAVYDAAKGGK